MTAPSGRSLGLRARKGINTALLRTTGYELRRGLGDWSAKLRSGTIQPAPPPPPDHVPAVLRPVARAWGYLP